MKLTPAETRTWTHRLERASMLSVMTAAAIAAVGLLLSLLWRWFEIRVRRLDAAARQVAARERQEAERRRSAVLPWLPCPDSCTKSDHPCYEGLAISPDPEGARMELPELVARGFASPCETCEGVGRVSRGSFAALLAGRLKLEGSDEERRIEILHAYPGLDPDVVRDVLNSRGADRARADDHV